MSVYLIRHRTHYSYEMPAAESHNLACLRPRSFPDQTIQSSRLEIRPEPEWESSWVDVYGNLRNSFSLSMDHQELDVTVYAKVDRRIPLQMNSPLTWEQAVLPSGDAWEGSQATNREFRCPSPQLPALAEPGFEADDCFPPGCNVMEALSYFLARVHQTFEYDPKATSTFTPIHEVFSKRAGVCQDFAHAAIAELRRRGFAAGYVSGYLETSPPPGREKLRGADATHAWYAVFVPGSGWIHFDPTNNVIPGDRHIVSAWGRDYGDVAPIKGVVFGGGVHEVDVEVDVWGWPGQVPPDMQNVLD